MGNGRKGIGNEAKGSRASLMYTLNAISHLSRDEFALLKKLRSISELNNEQKNLLGEDGTEALPKIQKIIKDFNVCSIKDVIEVLESFKIFDIYHF